MPVSATAPTTLPPRFSIQPRRFASVPPWPLADEVVHHYIFAILVDIPVKAGLTGQATGTIRTRMGHDVCLYNARSEGKCESLAEKFRQRRRYRVQAPTLVRVGADEYGRAAIADPGDQVTHWGHHRFADQGVDDSGTGIGANELHGSSPTQGTQVLVKPAMGLAPVGKESSRPEQWPEPLWPCDRTPLPSACSGSPGGAKECEA